VGEVENRKLKNNPTLALPKGEGMDFSPLLRRGVGGEVGIHVHYVKKLINI
jgi:hypothetical protein